MLGAVYGASLAARGAISSRRCSPPCARGVVSAGRVLPIVPPALADCSSAATCAGCLAARRGKAARAPRFMAVAGLGLDCSCKIIFPLSRVILSLFGHFPDVLGIHPVGERAVDFLAPCVRARGESSRALFLPFVETHKCASPLARSRHGHGSLAGLQFLSGWIACHGSAVSSCCRCGSGARVSQVGACRSAFPGCRFSQVAARILSRRLHRFRRARAAISCTAFLGFGFCR